MTRACKPATHVMIDPETTGAAPDAAILAIIQRPRSAGVAA